MTAVLCLPRKELGSLRMKVQCHEERILDSQFYAPFVDFMLKSVDEKMVSPSPLSPLSTLPHSLPPSLLPSSSSYSISPSLTPSSA